MIGCEKCDCGHCKDNLCNGSLLPDVKNSLCCNDDLCEKIETLSIENKYQSEIYKKYNDKIIILYASQTGTAERYAKSLKNYIKKFNIEAIVYNISNFEFSYLKDFCGINCVLVFIVSTYGSGEPPDDALKFKEWLSNDPNISKINYAILALGDSSYEKFGHFGKFVNKILTKYGSSFVIELEFCDARLNQESTYVEWRMKLIQKIKSNFSFPPVYYDCDLLDFKLIYHEESSLIFIGEPFKIGSYDKQKKPYHAKNPLLSYVIKNDELFKSNERSCKLISLDIKNTAIRYEPGDHLGIYTMNDKNLVNRLIELLNVDPNKVISVINVDNSQQYFPSPCTIRTAITYYLDITSPLSFDTLLSFIPYCSDQVDLEFVKLLTDPNDSKFYNDFIIHDHRNIIAILEEFHSLKPPIEVVIQSLPRLSCRYYSIASSQLTSPYEIQIAYVVVDWVTPSGRNQLGVTSNYLKKIDPISSLCQVPIFVRKTPKFRLPPKQNIPIIMIGCGVGVSPFRGFLQHRSQSNSKLGDMALFYGCRNKKCDYLFEDEFETYLQNKILTHLYTCFSRDSSPKLYIDTCILDNSKLIFNYLQNGAYIYICGASKILKNVQNAIFQSILNSSDFDETRVRNYIVNLKQKGRYCIDVW